MSVTYQTVCDICGKKVEGWPEHSQQHPGWMDIHYDLVNLNVCEECVPHVSRAIESLRSERQP